MDLNQDFTSYAPADWQREMAHYKTSRQSRAVWARQLRDELVTLRSETEGFRAASEDQKQEARVLAGKVQVLHAIGAGTYEDGGTRHPGHQATPGMGSADLRDAITLRADQSYAAWSRAHGEPRPANGGQLDFGKWLKGQVTGDWDGAGLELQASMQEGSIGTGGALVPSPLSTMLIDLARAKTRVIEAGAVTVPMTAATLAIARLASDPGSAWKTESAAVASPTDPTFERVTFTARTLVGFVRASRELFEDAANLGQVVGDMFAKTLARKLDLAALYGSGIAPEPTGVKNTAGITTKSMGTNGAALTNYNPLVDQAQSLWQANFDDPTAFIMSPRTRGNFGRLVDTLGQPMRPSDEVADIPRLDTSAVPNNLTQGTSNLA